VERIMSTRYVYYFGNGQADGGREDKTLLGSKGANLAEMTRIGIPVPPGFTITTDVCRQYLRDRRYPEGITAEVEAAVARMERDTGKQFGGGANPLLVSVRSGASVSMPGMMETILNLGLNDETAAALASGSGDERFAYDSYRRFVQMYADVVLDVPNSVFEARLAELKAERGVQRDVDLSGADLRQLVQEFKAMAREHSGERFPEDPEEQLWGAIEAVFRSWNVERAVAYRRVHGIPHYLGTAVSVVTMAYGNMGDGSGTGVAFTRDPSTGERTFFGEFLLNAQGEDVVAGTRTPLSISEMAHLLPPSYAELVEVQAKLERHYREMQDLEFTVERGRLYLLQTRTGKRTAAAAVRIAVDMVDEGLIDEAEAVQRIDPKQVDQLLHPRLDPDAPAQLLVIGLPASPGAASGRIVFDPTVAANRAAQGEDVILVREETSPDDFHGMVAARAVVTSRGGMTSHAAVVARGMGKCCVVGASDLSVDHTAGSCRANGTTVAEGEWITVDGTTGRVLLGQVPTVEQELGEDFQRLMRWADAVRVLKVRANADTPEDARRAREFGAEGIGLCRTEHMFFDADRIQHVREMILAQTSEQRRAALGRLLPVQRSDFAEIFRAMDGYPVTVRLLDPPLHEFLPRTAEEVAHFAARAQVPAEEVSRLLEKHRESNPMLGHRGVRLSISYPEIPEMQARAILEAALTVSAEGVRVLPEIMIPLVADERELAHQREVITRVAAEVFAERGQSVPYLVGTMIELPRAALMAADIATAADFFSFGTNDLTQTTYGISRDDAATFLPRYIEEGIFVDDPFQVLDREGVGQLVQMATWEGRQRRRDLKVGICGEHGGDPSSVEFFHETGLDYVSCSPFRVPVARLAAAQAALRTGTSTRVVAERRVLQAESLTAAAALARSGARAAQEPRGAPPAQESSGAPPAKESSGAPPAQESSGAPPAQESRGAPPAQESRGTPPDEQPGAALPV
jgi:pyruvate, orthophosphate dikinase